MRPNCNIGHGCLDQSNNEFEQLKKAGCLSGCSTYDYGKMSAWEKICYIRGCNCPGSNYTPTGSPLTQAAWEHCLCLIKDYNIFTLEKWISVNASCIKLSVASNTDICDTVIKGYTWPSVRVCYMFFFNKNIKLFFIWDGTIKRLFLTIHIYISS